MRLFATSFHNAKMDVYKYARKKKRLESKQFYEPVINVRYLHVEVSVLPSYTDVALLEGLMQMMMHVNL